MSEFIIHPSSVKGSIAEEQRIANQLINVQNSIGSIMNNLQFNIASSAMIRARLKKSYSDVYQCRRSVVSMSQALNRSVNKYEQTEKRICSNAKVGKPSWIGGNEGYSSSQQNKKDTSKVSKKTVKTKERKAKWKDVILKIISGIGPGGKIVSGLGKVVTGDKSKYATWGSAIKDIVKGFEKIAKKVKEAKSGVSVNWGKVLLGGDTYKTGYTFIDNVGIEIGKVSPVSAGASALASLFENIDEYQEGGMSKTRFFEETVMETIIDIGKGVLVTAGVSTICAAVALAFGFTVPALAVGVISALAIWGIDLLCQYFTEKKFNDLLGDSLLGDT